MSYRTGLQLKKEILKLLKEKPHVVYELERKVRTSDRVLNRHLSELEFLGIIDIEKHEKSLKTGRPYRVAKIKKSTL